MNKKRELWTLIAVVLVIALLAGCKKQTEGFGLGDTYSLPETVEIDAGTFSMGNTRGDKIGDSNETPVHEVELTYGYEIGKYEITNDQFLEFLNDAGVSADGILNGHVIVETDEGSSYNHEDGKFSLKSNRNKNWPAKAMTWFGAIQYCNWLSQKEGLSKAYSNGGEFLDGITEVQGYRLPTEAEWEYAARGAENDIGTDTDYEYAGSDDLNKVGWYHGNEDDDTDEPWVREVGTKDPNEIGIYDMSGNVREWCHDSYGSYPTEKQTNPVNSSGDDRVTRGGDWNAADSWCRVAHRYYNDRATHQMKLGFRIAKTSH